MLFYVTMGYKLRRFARLAERVYKVITGLWLRLKYKWLGYDVLGLYKREDFDESCPIGYTLNKLFGRYSIQLTPELCIYHQNYRWRYRRLWPEVYTNRLL